MHIDDSLLAKLEKLSHLRIDESKKEEVKDQLSEILDYVENLKELETDHLSATFSTLTEGTPMRDDTPHVEAKISTDILKNAPQSEDDFFIVPAIID